MTNAFAIALRADITKHCFCGTEKPFIQDFQASLQTGEMIALTGPSGCGKSTLLHLLSGLTKPSEGRVIINDIDIASLNDQKLSEFRNRNIGFVYQSHGLLKDFTALENIALSARIQTTSVLATQKALDCMRTMNIEHLSDQMPQSLSGGEKQRVAVARAIVNTPKVLFADEPTGNLDRNNANLVLNILQKLCKQHRMTVVMATHDTKILNHFDRVISLDSN